ncbi:MAG TPA: CpXC domain-containing protein [Anaerolineae bacterium]|nr:CpXC domain-containing protein [Anaerolineae bacterium]
MKFPPTPTTVRCPFCGSPITVQVQRVIDAHEQPELKARLLSGRLNVFTCPTCHNTGALAAPFIYHDADKELALIFLPLESGLNNTDQQKIIGQLTQAVMNSVPPEKRKAYLLQPQQFFKLQSLVEEVLRADGVTPEMMQAQQARLDLLQRLVDTRDAAAFEAIVKENDATIDAAFLQLVTAALAAAQADNQPEEFARLSTVRNRLFELTTLGQRARAQSAAVNAFAANPTRENLLEQITQAADSTTREALLAVGRPLLDYPFFQQLTGKLDAAKAAGNTAEAERFTELRKEILALRDKIDAQAQLAMEQRATILRELLMSENLEEAARARANALDELFFNILSSEMQAAQQANDAKTYERLRQVGNVALQVIQQMQPPEIQFLSALLAAQYPDQTRMLLERNRQALVPEFVDWLEGIVAELREEGREESADHLMQVIAQARELAGVKAAS